MVLIYYGGRSQFCQSRRRAALLGACLAVLAWLSRPARAEDFSADRETGINYSWAYPFHLQTKFEDLRVRYQFWSPRLSWPIDDAGHFRFVAENRYGYFYQPTEAFSWSLDLLMDYYPIPKGTLVPVVEAGAGLLTTDFSRLDGPINFELQVGAGLQYRPGGPIAITAGMRGHHISNGGIYKPNIGINAWMPVVGISYFYGKK